MLWLRWVKDKTTTYFQNIPKEMQGSKLTLRRSSPNIV